MTQSTNAELPNSVVERFAELARQVPLSNITEKVWCRQLTQEQRQRAEQSETHATSRPIRALGRPSAFPATRTDRKGPTRPRTVLGSFRRMTQCRPIGNSWRRDIFRPAFEAGGRPS